MESTDSTSGGSPPQQQQMQPQPQLPPGFRFHPTDEELVVHYLKRKAASVPLPVAIIAEVDLYKFDPWELPGKATFGEQEWYFFSPRDRKYPNGARPNRAATSGYWKATGTDKPILSSIDAPGSHKKKVGVKKALVFYGGKPPKGIKTNWIMHEYRLADSSINTRPPHPATPHAIMSSANGKKASLRLDDWVLCRIYKKNNSSSNSSNCVPRPLGEHEGNDDHAISMDNELSLSTEQASLLHLQATARLQQPIPNPRGRLPQHQHQHKRSFDAAATATELAATTNYSSAMLHMNDDTFFQGFLPNNTHEQDTNSMTCNTTVQLAGSPTIAAAVTTGGNMGCNIMSKREQLQQQLCFDVTPTFQAKQALTPAPAYWCTDAAAAVGNINPQPSPFKRFQEYDDGDGGSISSNSNKTTNVIKNSNTTSSDNNNNGNSTDHADHEDGHTIRTMLHQQIPQMSTIAANDYHQHSLLGSLGDGTDSTVFRQVPYQLLSSMNWRSST